jgi:hypothetical protein
MPLDRLDTAIAFAVVLLGVSMIVTLLTQIVSGLFAYRGRYLLEGLEELFKTLDPDLSDKAKALAKNVLSHPIASDSMFAKVPGAPEAWKLASAIRPEELVRLLNHPDIKKDDVAASIDKMLGSINPTIAREIRVIEGLFQKTSPNATTATQPTGGINLPAAVGAPVPGNPPSQLAAVLPALAITGGDLLKQISTRADQAVGNLEAWFSSAMDRVSQRYTLKMRIWTIIFSFAVALFAHFDAFRVYADISAQPSLRTALVGATDTMMKQAVEVLNQSPPSAAQGQAAQAPPDIQRLANELKLVQQTFGGAGFQLIPYPWPGYIYGKREFVGIMVAAALLSLGAPFWFNALKSLSNLRPVVADKQAKEQKS